jgi:hypothetical protein
MNRLIKIIYNHLKRNKKIKVYCHFFNNQMRTSLGYTTKVNFYTAFQGRGSTAQKSNVRIVIARNTFFKNINC